MTNEIKIGETTFLPDTHCVDADTGLDVWSFSQGLVREMLAASDKGRLLLQRDELLAALEEATDVVIGHYGTEGRLAKNCLAAIARVKGGAA